MSNGNDKLSPGASCAVCGDVATGNHYSVPSCNGCKTFFRRAIVNHKNYICANKGKCVIDKGVRCACRSCRFEKCLFVGMDPNAIQSERDRIGYTTRKRRRRDEQQEQVRPNEESCPSSCSPVERDKVDEHGYNSNEGEYSDEEDITFCGSGELPGPRDSAGHHRSNKSNFDGILEKLTQLENNFTLLLSRGEIHPYASLEEAIRAPSRFSQPVNVKLTDPIVTPNNDQQTMPFWRSRIIALYIDWAKTFSAFRKLPYPDMVALITNHASSYMIMCEAFRTQELNHNDAIMNGIEKIAEKLPREKCADLAKFIPAGNSSSNSNCQVQMASTSERGEDVVRISNQRGNVQANNTGEESKCNGDGVKAESKLFANSSPSSLHLPPKMANGNIHTFFDPQLIRDGNNCLQTGVRSLVDVPPGVHYPTVGNLSGLTPVMAAMIDCVMKPFRRLNISTTEFAVLQAIMFFDPDTEGLDAASQRNVSAERKKVICALYSHICQLHELNEAEKRFSSILLRIPMIRKVATKKNESLRIIEIFASIFPTKMLDMFNLFTLNSLVKETTLGIKGTSANQQNNDQ